jgi:hypothetical protein
MCLTSRPHRPALFAEIGAFHRLPTAELGLNQGRDSPIVMQRNHFKKKELENISNKNSTTE